MIASDRAALNRLFASCSTNTIVDRFFAPVSRYPAPYLEGVLAGRPDEHDAVVVAFGDGLHLAGLASFVRSPEGGIRRGEVGVLVTDSWQRRGLGAAMVRLLLARARARGIEEMTASVLPHRRSLLDALAAFGEPAGTVIDEDSISGRFRLPVRTC